MTEPTQPPDGQPPGDESGDDADHEAAPETLADAGVDGGDPEADELDDLAAEIDGIFVDGTPEVSDLAAERDEYRDALLRVKADFENYRKRVAKDQALATARASEGIVTDLLPALDACDAAVAHGVEGVEPIRKLLLDILGRSGLAQLDPAGEPFDPTLHEAAIMEPGEGEQVVSETLRTGYQFGGVLLRPAVVKVKG